MRETIPHITLPAIRPSLENVCDQFGTWRNRGGIGIACTAFVFGVIGDSLLISTPPATGFPPVDIEICIP